MSSTGAIPKGGVRPKDDSEVSGEPLDKKFISQNIKGLEKRIPALHKGWVEKGTYIKYDPPPLPDEDGTLPPGARESWLEQMEFLEQDLQNLLNLPHHRFWSYVVFDPAIHECLETYITNGPRWYDEGTVNDYSQPIVESIHKLVFLIYVRMATFKESKNCHITPSVFGEIIYDNFLFDICKLLDICVLYGPNNSVLIGKMISNIFANQPKYYDDLEQIVSSISMALENIEEKLHVAENFIPVALGSIEEELTLAELHDLTLYLLDTFYSLKMLISLHPPASKVFHKASFELRLSACYERVIPTLMESLFNWSQEPEHALWATKLIQKVQIARACMLATFRYILHDKCIAPLSASEKPLQTTVEGCIEKFVQVMSTCVEEKVFISDYCSLFPLSKETEFFQQHDGDITSLSFITDAVQSVLLEMGLSNDLKELTLQDGAEDSVDVSGMNGYAEVGSSLPTDIEMASLVSSVQDLLPDLGAGFIQECLKYYNYSAEEVINALLEGNLPPSLVTLDRNMPATEQPPVEEPPSEEVNEANTVCQVDYMDRANVYNNDEFDVFNRKDIDMSKIHKGKKPNKQQKEGMDKASVDKVREIARMYDERGGRSIYEDELDYEEDEEEGFSKWNYDDEYDDTYDDNEARNIDDFEIDKRVKRRPGIIGAGAMNNHFHYEDDSDEDETEEEAQTSISQQAPGSQGSKQGYPGGARPKNKGNTRGLQRVQSNSKSSKPKGQTPTPEREQEEDVNGPSKNQTSSGVNFVPFCENPEDVRKRREQQRLNNMANRGYRGRGGRPARNTETQNGFEGEKRPKVSHSSNKNSGKSWRSGEYNDDENRKHGGKYKEDTNHGKMQSREYRNKMIHKNEHKRQGAQAKFNRNN
ncbi:activating signal cointegrator 1 complex subunit 2-like [Penaeus japonicus]|uniref:activating signal cointegrator 1 complex subunit 2-like n=1 Tax=Penaeus japonicus TaxID=27405 RepID=UPI001C714418|nr:activating signal cointegrator 1 complex subunit 2-like [Penaeus japonicus]